MNLTHQTQADRERLAGFRSGLIRGIIGLGNVYRRLLAAAFGILGPEPAYWISERLARAMYRLLDPLRIISEKQCEAALGTRLDPKAMADIAEQAFVHRVWNLADLLLADRCLHPGTFFRYGGTIAESDRRPLIDAQRRRQPLILLTGYYGPYDLLPVFLGFQGIELTAVYLPHENAAYDRFRQRIRRRGGCEFVPVDQAPARLPDVLERGGTVAMVADHHAEHRGLPETFLGVSTRAMRTVGLLAARYRADILVAGIRRVNRAFRFELVFSSLLEHRQWQDMEDPLPFITDGYLRGLEQLVLGDPSQYLWSAPRWGDDRLRQWRAEDEKGG